MKGWASAGVVWKKQGVGEERVTKMKNMNTRDDRWRRSYIAETEVMP